jgi:succinate dehydrogenase / fumarate reductase, cytochrome b subunit
MDMADSRKVERPLSPHLQIYSRMLTMIMSIMHRITGVILYGGAILLVAWLLAAATSEAAFNAVAAVYGSWFGLIVLFGFSWALIHHALGGIRHLIWDTGRGFNLDTVEWMAKANIAGSIVLTVALWALGYGWAS